MKSFSLLLIVFCLANGCGNPPEEIKSKAINVDRNLNLEVLFTIYNQIWTPFLDEGVSEEMLAKTRLMKMNYEHFQAHSEHEAVSIVANFLNRSGTDFFLYAFYYNDFPNATRKTEIPELLTNDINSDRELAIQEIDSIMSMIADFYRVSEFEEFYRVNQSVYETAIEEVENHLPKNEFIPFMENYFGIEHEGYDFYVIPFFKTEFGMAHELERSKGPRNITFISPFETAQLDDVGQVQYVGYESEEYILEWVVHEYAHTFFNPPLTTAENLNELDNYKHLYQTIPDNPQIGNWFSMFAEHLAVAFEVRAAELMGENDRANKILKRHVT